eukprot:6327763-Prymnesium_polylepis.2
MCRSSSARWRKTGSSSSSDMTGVQECRPRTPRFGGCLAIALAQMLLPATPERHGGRLRRAETSVIVAWRRPEERKVGLMAARAARLHASPAGPPDSA